MIKQRFAYGVKIPSNLELSSIENSERPSIEFVVNFEKSLFFFASVNLSIDETQNFTHQRQTTRHRFVIMVRFCVKWKTKKGTGCPIITCKVKGHREGGGWQVLSPLHRYFCVNQLRNVDAYLLSIAVLHFYIRRPQSVDGRPSQRKHLSEVTQRRLGVTGFD